MKLGIVGLPNVGKSTLFNSLTKAGAESANYPFCTIDPNVGVVTVPDERLDRLAALYNSAKITPAVIEFVDIAGLVKGASKGEGLGNQFLANIREVDAIVHVVRCFEDSNIVHVDGSIDPLRDIETINLELIFSDMEVLERRLSKQKRASYNNKEIAKECDLIERLIAFLEAGNLAKNFELEDEDEEAFFKEYNLLTAKPVIFAANVTEDDLANDGADNKYVQAVREFAEKEHCGVFVICAQIEQEISRRCSSKTLDSSLQDLISLFQQATVFLDLSAISQQVRQRQERGQLLRVQKHLRQPERFTVILREALLRQKSYLMTI